MWVCEKNYDCVECPRVYEDCECDHWIEVEPVAYAEWKDDGDPCTFICGRCNYRVQRYNNTNFCPNCGAKMIKDIQ